MIGFKFVKILETEIVEDFYHLLQQINQGFAIMIETSSIFLIGFVDKLDVIEEEIDKVVGVKQNYTTGHVG